MNLRVLKAAMGVLSIAALSACGGPFVAATPPGFVVFDKLYDDDEYRAATPDGVVLGVRAFENDPKGDTAFWARAIENRMREVGGYALLEKRTVTNRGGLTGTQFRFGHDEGTRPHLYWLTVFSTEDQVFLLEAGGTKEEMTRQEAQLDWSVRNFLQR